MFTTNQQRVINEFQSLCDKHLIYTTKNGFKCYPEFYIGNGEFRLNGRALELIWDNEGVFVRNPFPEDDYTEILFESPQLQFRTALKYLLKLKRSKNPKTL